MNNVFIIAEVGVNHNGNIDLAYKLVDEAVLAGADAVKFQTFKSEKLTTKQASLANYQVASGVAEDSQFEMLKNLELSYEDHFELKEYCEEKNIIFLSTAFDHESLDFLLNDLKLTTLKIPSGEITNGPLILATAKSGCDLIVSTGMTTLEEIEAALKVIAFGLNEIDQKPTAELLSENYKSKEAKFNLQNKVTLLHCTSEYPAKFEDINLNAMITLKEKFGLNIGYSDHSQGITVPAAAVAMGAKIIEKHFTLDRSLPGPDHKASLIPSELKEMVRQIREIEIILGSPDKQPSESELPNRQVARKSLVAASNIKKGDVFTVENIAIKRPGTGISPMEYWQILGTTSNKDYDDGDLIS